MGYLADFAIEYVYRFGHRQAAEPTLAKSYGVWQDVYRLFTRKALAEAGRGGVGKFYPNADNQIAFFNRLTRRLSGSSPAVSTHETRAAFIKKPLSHYQRNVRQRDLTYPLLQRLLKPKTRRQIIRQQRHLFDASQALF